MRDLPNLGDKNKEPPLCYPYSIKARALIHAHLSRLELPRLTLKSGKPLDILVSIRKLMRSQLTVSTICLNTPANAFTINNSLSETS